MNSSAQSARGVVASDLSSFAAWSIGCLEPHRWLYLLSFHPCCRCRRSTLGWCLCLLGRRRLSKFLQGSSVGQLRRFCIQRSWNQFRAERSRKLSQLDLWCMPNYWHPQCSCSWHSHTSGTCTWWDWNQPWCKLKSLWVRCQRKIWIVRPGNIQGRLPHRKRAWRRPPGYVWTTVMAHMGRWMSTSRQSRHRRKQRWQRPCHCSSPCLHPSMDRSFQQVG